MTQTELAEYVAQREALNLPLFDGDPPSQHDVMRWAAKKMLPELERKANQEFGRRRHLLFRSLYLGQILDFFPDAKLVVEEKCYYFGGYKFYPETNELLIDGFKIDKGFVFIDKLLRNMKCK